MKLHYISIPASIGIALLSPLAAQASDLSLSFTPGTQSVVLGTATTWTFAGTLTNASATDDIFLNSDSLSLIANGTTSTDTPFQNDINSPTSPIYDNSAGIDGTYAYLTPGESISLDLFTVTLDGTTPLGVYPGSFTISGGEGEANKGNNDLLLGANGASFAVSVENLPTPPPITGIVPEASSCGLLGLGLLPLGLVAARRRARA